MAEKRKLIAEIEKCFKKIDEGVELFEETMMKMQEANSDNQREKYQDDLKKEIKKLQRLRDQVKGWQNCSDIKDKDKLNNYRKVIEQRMEQFKDIERENKTKPHSKQGLSAEEKLDPKEKEKQETIDWLQNQIRYLSDDSDRTETVIEALMTQDNGNKRRNKKDEGKKGDKEKKLEELRKHLDRMKFHIGKLEVCMRMVNNESLESKEVVDKLYDPLAEYTDALKKEVDPEELEVLDPEYIYDELNLNALTASLGEVQLNSFDNEKHENGHENGSLDGLVLDDLAMGKTSRHGSTDGPASPAPRRTVAAAVTAAAASSSPSGQARLSKEGSTEGVVISLVSNNVSVPATPPPPPPGIPYNSVAAGRTSASTNPPLISSSTTAAAVVKNSSVTVQAAPKPTTPLSPIAVVTTTPTAPPASVSAAPSNDENRSPSLLKNEAAQSNSSSVSTSAAISLDKTMAVAVAEMADPKSVDPIGTPARKSTETSIAAATLTAASTTATGKNSLPDGVDEMRALCRLSNSQQPGSEPQKAHIPAWLGASPLGRAPQSAEYDQHLLALDSALTRTPLPMDSERPRTYLPKIPCPCSPYYPQTTPSNGDTLEYYLRLSPETLFFIFYYMEGTRAQLLSAKALKKLSWRFHTKYLTWFQRHEEPKQITDDFEQGTYVYFDFEKWSQRKKEAFTFEYRYLEDKDFD